MDMTSKIPIALIGIEKPLLSTINLILANSLSDEFVISKPDTDERICIFQITTAESKSELKEYREKYPDRLMIMIGSEELDDDNVVHLTPPVSPGRLVEALKAAEKGIGSKNRTKKKGNDSSSTGQTVEQDSKQIDIEEGDSKFISSQKDVDLSDDEQLNDIYYSPEGYLQARLRTAFEKGKEENKNVQLRSQYGTFFYYVNHEKVHVVLNYYRLHNLARVPDASYSLPIFKFDAEDLPHPKEDKQVCGADTLIWQCTLWASRGRLPEGTDLDKPFILKHWPNFTRWMITPSAMQITILWLGMPTTLRETVEIMAIPQRDVFAFYSAALELGMIDFDVADTRDQMVDKKKGLVRKRGGLISRLIDYVKPTDGGSYE